MIQTSKGQRKVSVLWGCLTITEVEFIQIFYSFRPSNLSVMGTGMNLDQFPLFFGKLFYTIIITKWKINNDKNMKENE